MEMRNQSMKVFNEFLDLVSRATVNDEHSPLEELQQHYDNANRHFLWSQEFLSIVGEYSARIVTDGVKKREYIHDFIEVLKRYRMAVPLKHLISQRADLPDAATISPRKRKCLGDTDSPVPTKHSNQNSSHSTSDQQPSHTQGPKIGQDVKQLKASNAIPGAVESRNVLPRRPATANAPKVAAMGTVAARAATADPKKSSFYNAVDLVTPTRIKSTATVTGIQNQCDSQQFGDQSRPVRNANIGQMQQDSIQVINIDDDDDEKDDEDDDDVICCDDSITEPNGAPISSRNGQLSSVVTAEADRTTTSTLQLLSQKPRLMGPKSKIQRTVCSEGASGSKMTSSDGPVKPVSIVVAVSAIREVEALHLASHPTAQIKHRMGPKSKVHKTVTCEKSFDSLIAMQNSCNTEKSESSTVIQKEIGNDLTTASSHSVAQIPRRMGPKSKVQTQTDCKEASTMGHVTFSSISAAVAKMVDIPEKPSSIIVIGSEIEEDVVSGDSSLVAVESVNKNNNGKSSDSCRAAIASSSSDSISKSGACVDKSSYQSIPAGISNFALQFNAPEIKDSYSSEVDIDRNGLKLSRVSVSHIRRLERLLRDLDEKIKQLEEADQSLDEMAGSDSNYILEDKYQRKFVKVWSKLCQLNARPVATGRICEKKVKLEPCRYQEINKKINKYINRHHQFPDYQDVCTIITRCNEHYNLRLSKAMIDDLARSVFTDVGVKLQKRRLQDYTENFGSHVTDKIRLYDDPALYDTELQRKLDENKTIGVRKLEEVIEKYVKEEANIIQAGMDSQPGTALLGNNENHSESESEDEEYDESSDESILLINDDSGDGNDDTDDNDNSKDSREKIFMEDAISCSDDDDSIASSDAESDKDSLLSDTSSLSGDKDSTEVELKRPKPRQVLDSDDNASSLSDEDNKCFDRNVVNIDKVIVADNNQHVASVSNASDTWEKLEAERSLQQTVHSNMAWSPSESSTLLIATGHPINPNNEKKGFLPNEFNVANKIVCCKVPSKDSTDCQDRSSSNPLDQVQAVVRSTNMSDSECVIVLDDTPDIDAGDEAVTDKACSKENPTVELLDNLSKEKSTAVLSDNSSKPDVTNQSPDNIPVPDTVTGAVQSYPIAASLIPAEKLVISEDFKIKNRRLMSTILAGAPAALHKEIISSVTPVSFKQKPLPRTETELKSPPVQASLGGSSGMAIEIDDDDDDLPVLCVSGDTSPGKVPNVSRDETDRLALSAVMQPHAILRETTVEAVEIIRTIRNISGVAAKEPNIVSEDSGTAAGVGTMAVCVEKTNSVALHNAEIATDKIFSNDADKSTTNTLAADPSTGILHQQPDAALDKLGGTTVNLQPCALTGCEENSTTASRLLEQSKRINILPDGLESSHADVLKPSQAGGADCSDVVSPSNATDFGNNSACVGVKQSLNANKKEIQCLSSCYQTPQLATDLCRMKTSAVTEVQSHTITSPANRIYLSPQSLILPDDFKKKNRLLLSGLLSNGLQGHLSSVKNLASEIADKSDS